MKVATTVGVDLAKNVFQLHGVDAQGKTVYRERLKRDQMAEHFANKPPCRIVMEACGGAHHFGRKFKSQGHEAKLIAAQFVKPFKKGRQKNDTNDAEAIVEASLRPKMRYVAVKTVEQQDLQSLHRVRQQLIEVRVKFVNQIRGLLLEYGVVIDRGFTKFKAQFAEAIEADSEVTPSLRDLLMSLKRLVDKVCEEMASVDKKIVQSVKENEDCKRLMCIPGVGINSATLFIASVGNPNVFQNGRHVAAWLGLVPRQFSSGETIKLSGITKAGDNALRSTLVHGARALVLSIISKQKTDPTSLWVRRLHKEKGWNKTVVAVANRNARVMFSIMKNKVEYKIS